ncbi:hypothetical protein ACP4OV_017114 [Aristida adscensionis]
MHMLGRAGRLDEEDALAAAMPVPPDALVRGAGDAAHGGALHDRGGDAGDHVLLSNTYASRREMRRSKDEQGPRPGCSGVDVDVDGVLHEFRAILGNSLD